MDRWINKVAVVTGASAGIGAAICKDLVRAGMIVVGLARRKERIEALRADIPSNATGKLYAFTCDVAKDDDIERAFAWIESELGAVHVLINNAGIVRMGTITGEGSCEKDLQDTLRTNVWGTVQCTRKAVEIMKRKKVIGAHVVLINSIVGHKVVQPLGGPGAHPTFNVYPVSKFGITALGQVLQQEFNADGLQYKLTSISPGLVKTEICEEALFEQIKIFLSADDVSNAVLYALGTPAHVQIAELTLKPLGEQV